MIDAHFHLFDANRAAPGARYVPAYDAPFAAWRAAAHAVGVTRGVLVQPSFLGTDNTRLCAELRAHPGILRGVAVIDPACAPSQLRELDACGVRGIRFNLADASHALAPWRNAALVWDEIARLGWHVEVHTDAGALAGVLAQLPAGVPVVVDHMAKPAQASASDETIVALRSRAQRSAVHVKLSGAYRLPGMGAGAVAQVLRDELGSERLLWGSDWPCTNHENFADYPRLLAALYDWIGPDAATAALQANAGALYWGEPPAA